MEIQSIPLAYGHIGLLIAQGIFVSLSLYSVSVTIELSPAGMCENMGVGFVGEYSPASTSSGS